MAVWPILAVLGSQAMLAALASLTVFPVLAKAGPRVYAACAGYFNLVAGAVARMGVPALLTVLAALTTLLLVLATLTFLDLM